jgi:diaminopimelate decarboxylase
MEFVKKSYSNVACLHVQSRSENFRFGHKAGTAAQLREKFGNWEQKHRERNLLEVPSKSNSN